MGGGEGVKRKGFPCCVMVCASDDKNIHRFLSRRGGEGGCWREVVLSRTRNPECGWVGGWVGCEKVCCETGEEPSRGNKPQGTDKGGLRAREAEVQSSFGEKLAAVGASRRLQCLSNFRLVRKFEDTTVRSLIRFSPAFSLFALIFAFFALAKKSLHLIWKK